jgi:glucose/arabinose dehydrogenase
VTLARRPPRHPLAAVALGLTFALGAAGAAAAQQPSVPGGPSPAGPSQLELVRGGLSSPVFVTHADDDRLFVVEQSGRIKILRQRDGRWRVSSLFLDIREKVLFSGEQGLLGLAFHPDYAANGLFYVYYSRRNGDTIVGEYRRASHGKADEASFRRVLKIAQPDFPNHKGGWIGFMGDDLLVATGDGGSGGDPFGNGQDKGSLLGKILRIDPLDPPGLARYSIPTDNPLVGRSGRDEIWAWGLRNPWRDSLDRLTGDLYIGDVGQGAFEEVSHDGDGKGRNFGWARLEGSHLYPSGEPCQVRCRTLPIAEYGHDGGRCSVTGGYVSRREGAPLYGTYRFADYCTGEIWTVPADFTGGAALPQPVDTDLNISSFGEGADGTLYVVDIQGAVYRLVGS